MTIERIVRIIAGTFIMLSLLLAQLDGTVNLAHPSWLWFTLFIGFNLFQSGWTRFCPLDSILKKFGVQSGCSL